MSRSDRYSDLWRAIVVAFIITLIIRFSVYGDDCNLFISGVTFLFFFTVGYSAIIIVHRLRDRDA